MTGLGLDSPAPRVSILSPMKDAKESYGIMPFANSADEREWWVIRNRGMKVMHMLPTKEEAFNKALYHNRGFGYPCRVGDGLVCEEWKLG
jgi:hypothetical protein